MRYMGGKTRQGPKIAEVLTRVLKPEHTYVEPFCGALGAACRVRHPKMVLADWNQAIITFWKAVWKDWVPPDIDEKTFDKLKAARDPEDPRTAWAGFCFTFHSRWFAGYIGRYGGDPKRAAATARVQVLNKRMLLKSCQVRFVQSDYRELDIPKKSVLYLDPPYAGRSNAHAHDSWDGDAFWQWAAARKEPTIVTEFTVPSSWVIVHDFGNTVAAVNGGKRPDDIHEVIACPPSQRKFWL